MYGLYHNLLPTSLSSNFQRGFHIHNYFTRFSHQYRSHQARLKIKQLSINCLGPVLWNSLPEVIRKSPSMGMDVSGLIQCELQPFKWLAVVHRAGYISHPINFSLKKLTSNKAIYLC